jgi:hypothetical protein
MFAQNSGTTGSSIPCQALLHIVLDDVFRAGLFVLLDLVEELVESVDQKDIDPFHLKQLLKFDFDGLHHAPCRRRHEAFVH